MPSAFSANAPNIWNTLPLRLQLNSLVLFSHIKSLLPHFLSSVVVHSLPVVVCVPSAFDWFGFARLSSLACSVNETGLSVLTSLPEGGEWMNALQNDNGVLDFLQELPV